MYFQNFPRSPYEFDIGEAVFQDITKYAEVMDQVRDNTAFYQDYIIQHGERPDHVAYRLYNNPQYHWVLYLLNPQLRESGWPLSDQDVLLKVKKDYPHTVLNIDIEEDISTTFKVGQTVTGQRSGAQGTIVSKNTDLGQLVIETSDSFKNDGALESIISLVDDEYEQVDAVSAVPQYLATRHYLQDGDVVTSTADIIPPPPGWPETDDPDDPYPPAVPVTYYEYYVKSNNQLKQISVIRPDSISAVVSAVIEAIRS